MCDRPAPGHSMPVWLARHPRWTSQQSQIHVDGLCRDLKSTELIRPCHASKRAHGASLQWYRMTSCRHKVWSWKNLTKSQKNSQARGNAAALSWVRKHSEMSDLG